jgi:hypothetical protein
MKTIAQQINWDFGANGSLEIKNKNGKRIYFENSDGFWAKWEHDSQGNVMYYEDSDGDIVDKRPKPSIVEIDGVKYKTN